MATGKTLKAMPNGGKLTIAVAVLAAFAAAADLPWKMDGFSECVPAASSGSGVLEDMELGASGGGMSDSTRDGLQFLVLRSWDMGTSPAKTVKRYRTIRLVLTFH